MISARTPDPLAAGGMRSLCADLFTRFRRETIVFGSSKPMILMLV